MNLGPTPGERWLGVRLCSGAAPWGAAGAGPQCASGRVVHAGRSGVGRTWVRNLARRRLGCWLLMGGCLYFAGGCTTTPPREPPNLQPLKRQLRDYVESGAYERALAVVAAQAREWIEWRASQGGNRLTVVFDLDETLLSNWTVISRQDFGYVPVEWQRWVDEGGAPAIGPVRELFLAVRKLGIEVVFLSGRRERDRGGTERNLRAIGCADYTRLILMGDDDRRASAAFKLEVRQGLVAEGCTVIANVGDQESDLAGGFAERAFKLPNPFYATE